MFGLYKTAKIDIHQIQSGLQPKIEINVQTRAKVTKVAQAEFNEITQKLNADIHAIEKFYQTFWGKIVHFFNFITRSDPLKLAKQVQASLEIIKKDAPPEVQASLEKIKEDTLPEVQESLEEIKEDAPPQDKAEPTVEVEVENVPKPVDVPVIPARGSVDNAIERATDFKNYAIQIGMANILKFLANVPLILTAVSLRPANFFFDALGVETTLPGSGKLFAHTAPMATAERIRSLKDDEEIVFSAQGKKVQLKPGKHPSPPLDATEVYGNATYRLSGKEIKETLESQQIYLSPSMPKAFYTGLKRAMIEDGWVTLPGNEGNMHTVKGLAKGRGKVAAFLKLTAKNNPEFYAKIQSLTLYELGSMVVKRENFHVFVDGNGKILERNADSNDHLRLISACGIRGFSVTKTSKDELRMIMKETFKTALEASESGFVLFPAVGMGVWGGDPHVYWPAFIEAVLESERGFDQIFVNPGHKPTGPGYRSKNFAGAWNGDEFKHFMSLYAAHPRFARLQMIQDLSAPGSTGKDLVQLGRELKREFPDKIVSIFNASDPDVTLGNHVGEYVNNWPHTNTTEENFTALGTNGLCFEQITGVHQHPDRILEI